jgi:protein phosphatase
MGGEAAGQRAGRIAVRSVVDFLSSLRQPMTGPGERLKEALIRAHRDILAQGEGQICLAGMGTTLTAAILLGSGAHVVHAGDSRCYLLHRGGLRLLTNDHTAAAVLVARGQISPEAARTSRYRHILTNHVGGDGRMPEPELVSVHLEPGDGLLLTTDGLHDVLETSELADIASRPISAHAVCHMVVEAAQARGAKDDATAVFARSAP